MQAHQFTEPHSDWIREYEDAVDDLQRHPLPPPPPPQLERRPMPMHRSLCTILHSFT